MIFKKVCPSNFNKLRMYVPVNKTLSQPKKNVYHYFQYHIGPTLWLWRDMADKKRRIITIWKILQRCWKTGDLIKNRDHGLFCNKNCRYLSAHLIFNIGWQDKITNEELCWKVGQELVTKLILYSKKNWIGLSEIQHHQPKPGTYMGKRKRRQLKKNAWRCENKLEIKKQLNINHKDSPKLDSLTDWCWWTMFIWKQKGWIIQKIILSWVWR